MVIKWQGIGKAKVKKHAQLMVLHPVRGRLSQQAKQKRPGQSKTKRNAQRR
jgi:hypothetical protein